ncbi:MAG TPA: guanylate kinase [Blastocatellia bacterium]|nr:guanylate kinase [Blastocatellia bacterium]
MSSDPSKGQMESAPGQSELAETSERGRLIVVSAPSGAGKSTIIETVLPRIERLRFSVSYTTRSARLTEVEGEDYHFVSESEFTAMINRGEFAEWAKVHGNLYGTALSSIDDALANGDDIILDIDVQGADQIRRRVTDSFTVFVLPPSIQALEARLSKRNQNTSDDFQFRIANAAREVLRYEQFDYVIINDDLELAARTLEGIIRAERHRPSRMKARAQEIIETFGGNT